MQDLPITLLLSRSTPSDAPVKAPTATMAATPPVIMNMRAFGGAMIQVTQFHVGRLHGLQWLDVMADESHVGNVTVLLSRQGESGAGR